MDFTKIYDLNFELIFKYFFYRGVNRPSSEDLTHETFIVFYQKYSEIKSKPKARKLLYGIAKVLLKRFIDSQMKSKEIEYFDNLHFEISIDDLEDENFSQNIERKKSQIINAINEKLKGRVKDVITMRFIDRKTRKEVAKKLRINEKDVHSYQKRGVKYLKNVCDN